MKKLLTLTIIAVSIHASAQFNQSVSTKQQLPIIPFENSHHSIMDEKSQPHRIQRIDGINAIQLLKIMEQPVTQVNDSTYYWKWDTINLVWIINLKSIHLYNSNDDLISGLTQKWDGISWANNFSESHSFDANNNSISFMFQYW